MTLESAFIFLVITVYHEARGEPALGQRNVVKVILNRAESKKWPVENIVFARKQFSCWNSGLKDPSIWIKEIPTLINVSRNVVDGFHDWQAGDRLEGATHYFSIKGMAGNKPPYWSEKMKFICEVGGHRFLREG